MPATPAPKWNTPRTVGERNLISEVSSCLEMIERDLRDHKDNVVKNIPTILMMERFYSQTLQMARKLAGIQCKQLDQTFLTYELLERMAVNSITVPVITIN